MEAFDHILVATDFGDASDRALDCGLWLSAKFDSKLTLLHAYAASISGYGYAQGFVWPIEALERAAKGELEAAIGRAKGRHDKVEGILVRGEPWARILEAATTGNIDLIVMGTHGRKGFSHMLLGSVAEKVVRLSSVPVLTVSSSEERQANALTKGTYPTALSVGGTSVASPPWVPTSHAKLVTIIASGELRDQLEQDLLNLGASGYSTTRVDGRGEGGMRVRGPFETGNVRIETIVARETVERILAYFSSAG